MCFDPWEESIYTFAALYLDAVRESQDENRTDLHRHQWAGKAEFFEQGYKDKLTELDLDELDDFISGLIEDESDERLLKPAEAEQKRRAEEGEMAA